MKYNLVEKYYKSKNRQNILQHQQINMSKNIKLFKIVNRNNIKLELHGKCGKYYKETKWKTIDINNINNNTILFNCKNKKECHQKTNA